MPILKDEKVEVGKIAKDDVVKGRTAAVVKIGTKFAEIRDADGKMILRAPLRQTVAILRPRPTEEEVAARKAEREAQQRQWREEAITSWLDNADDRYAGAVAKFGEAVAGGWAPQIYWDQYTYLAKAQAEHRIAKEVQHVIARSAKKSAFEPMDACDAYDAWRDQARGSWSIADSVASQDQRTSSRTCSRTSTTPPWRGTSPRTVATSSETRSQDHEQQDRRIPTGLHRRRGGERPLDRLPARRDQPRG